MFGHGKTKIILRIPLQEMEYHICICYLKKDVLEQFPGGLVVWDSSLLKGLGSIPVQLRSPKAMHGEAKKRKKERCSMGKFVML